jgi:hypothetical protein
VQDEDALGKRGEESASSLNRSESSRQEKTIECDDKWKLFLRMRIANTRGEIGHTDVQRVAN